MQTQHYGLEQTRIQLPRILSHAHAGRASVITRHGKPYAAIVPLSQLQKTIRETTFLTLKGTGAGLWGDSVAQTSDDLRNEWD